ncbi:X-X-X-Leu-X-X-Gly heptad repeats [Agathobacter rectalis M104/1]|jgi:putative membrane protein|uniref:X-X-X-Leu-X-X-Gly heptad repeats n=1 Tax=Agathobacter rectalis TaxID=39491 RepID=UPI0001CD2C63|nr:X-X-X-Leu-X-X-Gly heptad repeats [Agathobacter rectalis]CBK93240.1 X-X-X-Leu-X-X-Gly heptad repeats [Agathobacter rectalis M104/1]
MKLPELKEKLKSKYIVRVVAGVLTIALVGTGIGATAVFAEKNSTAVTAEADSTTDSSKDADDIADKLMDSVSLKDNDADKDESVYLISDANGNVNKTIVVDHLKNKDKKDTLEDASNLSDIENVKGKEKFTQSGDKLTWQAGGKDIYYQGTATEEPPVTQKVTYYLDGKEISPEDLAGKSGKVKICFDYTNTTSYTETVNGEKQTVSVPFAAITGLVLGDGFENIEVTNGKAEVSDSSSVVLGYALPGLKDSLGIKDKDLDGDVNIPEYMEMTADVKNFSMPAAMTFVVNASDYVSTDGIDTSDLDDMINDLKDASTQLQDGSKTLAEGTDTLADGLSTLQSKLGTFASGVGTLQSGLKTYTDGVSTLSGGLNTLGNSTGALVSGADKLNSGAGQLASGSATLKDGLKTYTNGASQLNTGLNQLNDSTGSLATGVTSLNDGAKTLSDGINAANKGAAGVSAGVAQLKTSIDTAKTGADSLTAGAKQVDEGVDKLKQSLSDMPETIKARINQSLEPLNKLNVGKLFKTLGYIDTDKITVDNVSAAADAAVNNAGDIITALTSMNDPYPSATYNKILVGLSQGKGAVSVYSVVNKSVTDSASTVKALKDGSAKVSEGASSLDAGLGQLADGASELSSGASDLAKGTTKLATGATELQTGTQSLADKLPELTKGITSLVNGSNELVKNNDTLNAGATALNAGASQLSAGTQSLMNSVPTLTSGIKQLVDGSNTLVANNAQLNSGASQLADGTNQIVSGVDQLTTGSKTLSEGAHTLADGMVQFNEEGINKILDAYNGDLKPFTDKLQAVIDAGEEYQTYSAIADGQTGSVKFIYKLASIDAKADSDK